PPIALHFAAICEDALTGKDQAHHVHRNGRRDRYRLAGWLLVAHRAQRLGRHWQRELLSQKAADEPAAPNLPAVFKPLRIISSSRHFGRIDSRVRSSRKTIP